MQAHFIFIKVLTKLYSLPGRVKGKGEKKPKTKVQTFQIIWSKYSRAVKCYEVA